MLYTNISFILLFILLAMLTRFLPNAMRKYVLIIASLGVIATWGWASLIIFLLTVVAGFIFIDLMSRRQSTEEHRVSQRNILLIGVAFNLLLLALFKYREFLLGPHLSQLIAGPLTQIGIPLGISFYSFHIISYLIDSYRGNHERVSFSDFLFYLSFFPHVIAGPIVRGWQLMPQIYQKRKLNRDFIFGSHLFITGFFLKTVCADNIGAVIDPYWTTSAPNLSTGGHWLVALFYYFQLYGDFAGYSLMACGMARLLGYRLPSNFAAPMRAVGFQDFWRRWHITLSRWLRDYLYIPLGGNRVGVARTYLNLLIVMGLGGLWHGAAWTFIAWGAIHGGGLVLERLLRITKVTGFKMPLWWLFSQVIILIAWVFFRAPSLGFASDFIQQMFSFPVHAFKVDSRLGWLGVYTLPLIFHHLAPYVIKRASSAVLVPMLGCFSGFMLIATTIIQSPPAVFIYFAF